MGAGREAVRRAGAQERYRTSLPVARGRAIGPSAHYRHVTAERNMTGAPDAYVRRRARCRAPGPHPARTPCDVLRGGAVPDSPAGADLRRRGRRAGARRGVAMPGRRGGRRAPHLLRSGPPVGRQMERSCAGCVRCGRWCAGGGPHRSVSRVPRRRDVHTRREQADFERQLDHAVRRIPGAYAWRASRSPPQLGPGPPESRVGGPDAAPGPAASPAAFRPVRARTRVHGGGEPAIPAAQGGRGAGEGRGPDAAVVVSRAALPGGRKAPFG